MILLAPQPSHTAIGDEYRRLCTATGREVPELNGFCAADYDPESLRAARAHWRKRMVDEYCSTTVFSGLAAQLVEANAPLDASVVVLRMAQDEFRHAEVCGRVLTALGGVPRARFDASVKPLAVHPGCSPEERALRNVLVTSISEMHSVAYFVASLDRMTDPSLRAVTRHLLTDEVMHGQFGFYYLDGCCDWLSERAETRANISNYLRLVFACCEREFVRESVRPGGADDDALGLVPNDLARQVFMDTMEHAVAPGLDRFGLEATRAWHTRTLG